MREPNVRDRDLNKRLNRCANKALENLAPYPGTIRLGIWYPYHNTLEALDTTWYSRLALLTRVATIENKYTGRLPNCNATACQKRQPQPSNSQSPTMIFGRGRRRRT